MFSRFAVAILAALLAAGCASLPPDRGRAEVDRLAASRGLPMDVEALALAERLLAEPLGPEQSVRVALIRNPDLRADYARLGLSGAQVYRAGRLSNPMLSASRLESDEPGAMAEVSFGLSQSFTDLLTLADRSRLAEAEFARAQSRVAARVFETATATESAWYDFAAAIEIAEARAESADAATATAELAQRFFDAGNISRLVLAEHRAEAADARVAAIAARSESDRARARLGELMGLEASVEWRIRPGLPQPPASPPAMAALKREAADARLDLLAARRQVAATESALGVSKRWRWLGEVELTVETEREIDGSRLTGPGIGLELPVFNQHADRVARAEARLDAAYAERDAVANRVTHQLGLADARLAAARQRLEAFEAGILPEHRQRVGETQRRVNYMLAGVFDLMDARRDEYAAIAEYLAAVRDYWQAHVALERAAGSMIAGADPARRIRAQALMHAGAPAHRHHPPEDEAPHAHHDHEVNP